MKSKPNDFDYDNSRGVEEMMKAVRELGGEELAGQVVKANELAHEMLAKIGDAYQAYLTQCEEAGVPELLACTAACGPMSASYAIVVALLGAATPNCNMQELLATALRSFIQNLDLKIEEVKAEADNMSGVIKQAAAKGGK